MQQRMFKILILPEVCLADLLVLASCAEVTMTEKFNFLEYLGYWELVSASQLKTKKRATKTKNW